MTPIAFVGLGTMGGPMVRRLAERHDVLVYDVDRAKADDLARLSAVSAAGSLGELRDSRLVVLMLPNSDIVDAVVAGPDGLLEVLPSGALIVDMSSSDPRRTVELAANAERAGIALVDAPVSGGLARARTGDLTVMFGGTPEQLAACMPALEPMTTSVIPMGGVGAGHAMKALNNVMSAAGLSVATEVIEVGRRFGLDPKLMLEVLNRSTGRNHATETKVEQFVLSESFDSGFLLQLMLKDLAIAVDLASEMGVPIPMAEACLELWSRGAELLPPDADQTRIAQLPAGLGEEAAKGA